MTSRIAAARESVVRSSASTAIPASSTATSVQAPHRRPVRALRIGDERVAALDEPERVQPVESAVHRRFGDVTDYRELLDGDGRTRGCDEDLARDCVAEGVEDVRRVRPVVAPEVERLAGVAEHHRTCECFEHS
jgi:hypothetical protein